MEPRPQRPRTPQGQSRPTPQQGAPSYDAQGYAGGEFPPGVDPTAFVAPPRTEYDYSPLDLAPPGQRRRRQLVAAAIGGLSVVLLGAIIFFAYLLLREDDPPNSNETLAAAQTEVAQEAATVSANQTVVAQAAADQTAAAEGEGDTSGEETPAASETESAEAPATESAEGSEDETPASEGEPEQTETAGEETPAAPDLSGNASLDNDGLTELLPSQEQVPEGLTSVEDTSPTQEQVVESLGGGRPAEANLTDWGWSGNVDRTFTNADPENADPASTTYLSVSVHGFGSPASSEAALPFFSDILTAAGYAEVDRPDIGDEAVLLTMVDENGQTWSTLYVRDGSVLYRIRAMSPGGDPSEGVLTLAADLIG